MVQNRNKLIELFIGNITNSILHDILKKAIIKEELVGLADKYGKELITSFEIAKKYREKINPINNPLPIRDASYVKEKIIRKVKTELKIRIDKGYKNINLAVVEEETNKALKEMGIL